MANRPALSVSEREVLKVLWDHGPRTIREINEVLERQGRQWAYTTVATLLQRLVVKKYAANDSTAVHTFIAQLSAAMNCWTAGSRMPPKSFATVVRLRSFSPWCKATNSQPMKWPGSAGCSMRPPAGHPQRSPSHRDNSS